MSDATATDTSPAPPAAELLHSLGDEVSRIAAGVGDQVKQAVAKVADAAESSLQEREPELAQRFHSLRSSAEDVGTRLLAWARAHPAQAAVSTAVLLGVGAYVAARISEPRAPQAAS
jgi:hypothetical protein